MSGSTPSPWERFWFRPASPAGLMMARCAVCLNALWILLSRPDLPQVLGWPAVFWTRVTPETRWRFLMFDVPLGVERSLYVLLGLALVTGIFGWFPRASCLLAAVLLYHFAPLENVFSIPTGPHFRGLTVPILALFVLAFAEVPRWGAPPSAEFRWPLALIQLEFSFIYLFAGIAKLHAVGWHWISARNFQGLVLSMALPEYTAPWAQWLAGSPFLCWLGALGGVFMDFAVFFAVLSPRAARWLLPPVFLAHLVIVKAFGVIFLSAPLFLLFVDWDFVFGKLRFLRRMAPMLFRRNDLLVDSHEASG